MGFYECRDRSFQSMVPPLFCDQMTHSWFTRGVASINKQNGHDEDYRHFAPDSKWTCPYLTSNVWTLLTYRSEVPTSTHGSHSPSSHRSRFVTWPNATSGVCRMMATPSTHHLYIMSNTRGWPSSVYQESTLWFDAWNLPKMIRAQLVRWCFKLIDRLEWSGHGHRLLRASSAEHILVKNFQLCTWLAKQNDGTELDPAGLLQSPRFS